MTQQPLRIFSLALIMSGLSVISVAQQTINEIPPNEVKVATPNEVQQNPNEEEILVFVDEDAQFPGGTAALQRWIVENQQFPGVEPGNASTGGKVYVVFVVEPDGKISNIRIERGINDALDQEAIRLVSTMPKWKPGKYNGKAIRQQCRVPINFTIY